jgi:ribonuclease III
MPSVSFASGFEVEEESTIARNGRDSLRLIPHYHISIGGQFRMSGFSLPGADQEEKLSRCEAIVGYRFKDRSLLLGALTHASGAEHRLASNERLEFLGDAILGAVVCELLYRRFPNYLEGDLTKIKSIVVSRVSCAKLSEALGFQDCLILGKGMAQNAELPSSLLADVFESLVAAIYLDGGSSESTRFIEATIGPEIELAEAGELEGNFKSQLQQLAQRDYCSTPIYQLLNEKGPDHAKCFQVSAQVGSHRYEPAWGRNKKEAEQRAASNAMAEIRSEPPPFTSDSA